MLGCSNFITWLLLTTLDLLCERIHLALDSLPHVYVTAWLRTATALMTGLAGASPNRIQVQICQLRFEASIIDRSGSSRCIRRANMLIVMVLEQSRIKVAPLLLKLLMLLLLSLVVYVGGCFGLHGGHGAMHLLILLLLCCHLFHTVVIINMISMSSSIAHSILVVC